jgi:hypothetical protein
MVAFYRGLTVDLYPVCGEELDVKGRCIASFCLGTFNNVAFVKQPEGKRPLGRPRRRWEDNIKMDLQEVGGSRGDWMELARNRDRWRALVGTVRNFRVP